MSGNLPQAPAPGQPELFDCRAAFANALEELAAADPRIIVLVNDSISSGSLGRFGKRYPGRLLNIGIAEQNMVGISAGLANGGKVPFVSSATCFLTGRALEQIKADVAYSNANVKLVGQSSGVAYGALGATHHSIEDFAWTRAIANLVTIAPADPVETDQAVRWAAAHIGPVFLRLSRAAVPAIHGADYRFQVGKASRLREGRDVTLVANGTMAARALAAADALSSQGIAARVLNLATVQPIDSEAIVAAAVETGGIVTVEEHSARGGLGAAVAEVVVQNRPVTMRILGVPGIFAPVGPADWILEQFGLTAEGIVAAAREVVSAKAR